MEKIIEIPEFDYLTQPYQGDYFYIHENSFFRLKITPEIDFESMALVMKNYIKLNNLLSIPIFRITYYSEIANISFINESQAFTIKLPIQVLCIENTKLDEITIFKPEINVVLIEKINGFLIYTINVDFAQFNIGIEKLSNTNNKYTISNL